MKMRTRFAPSLTGYLHLGHALHMKIVWEVAREKGGVVVCRMEDHDRSRWRAEYEPAILEDMDWLGFVPDEGLHLNHSPHPSPYRQSDCGGIYTSFLEKLKEAGKVYGCSCSRKEIAERTGGTGGELRYDGHCAERNLPLEGNTVRFRVPSEEVVFKDLRVGRQAQLPASQCGDFSLRDRHGQWTYQFCCVCDDIRQHINLVVRGEDLLESTGRQILLFRALKAPLPDYLHHELLLDQEQQKLSKRQQAQSLTAWRKAGISVEEIWPKIQQN